ncbi:QueT transporter family protein [Liquorilactobacillus sicerae]|uniref:QueT transporter family protein n=1 Tax=Liquorilactobacillus sicerae TaxID=1416943 RepID=UPI00247FB90F|nr:QueT transporter family protein [Liquorilactobacillus sicerae]
MNNKKLKLLVLNGLIAACYVVITALFSSFSFGVIQVRISTALYQLVAFNKHLYWGMVLGVVIANLLLSPFGLLDILVGLGVTGGGLAVAILINQKVKRRFIKSIVVGISVSLAMIFVAIELVAISKVPFVITYVYLVIGQLIAQVLGLVILSLINHKFDLQKLLSF